jgi:hypothetical protein
MKRLLTVPYRLAVFAYRYEGMRASDVYRLVSQLKADLARQVKLAWLFHQISTLRWEHVVLLFVSTLRQNCSHAAGWPT